MTEYLFYILTVIGISYFVTQATLTKPIREALSTLHVKKKWWITDKISGVVNCIYCSSFWIGIAVYYSIHLDTSINTILHAFSCMGAIYVVKNIFSKD